MKYSDYKEFYSTYLQDLTTANSDKSNTILHKAIAKLHISFIPETLPCRTAEKTMIQDLIRSYISEECNSKPIYISGMPGTGKTATVSSVIASLKNECSDMSLPLPEFQYIEINCLRLQSPNDACKSLRQNIISK
jgi:origin recognition complex subunit 1